MPNPYGVLPDDIGLTINSIAGKISREFGGFTEREDLAQGVWSWIGEFPARSAKWWYDVEVVIDHVKENGRYAITADGDIEQVTVTERAFANKRFRLDVTRCCATIARKDKAAVLGFEPEDQYAYSTRVIEKYLPYVWHSDVLTAIQDTREGPSAKIDPAKGGDAQASAMDVRRAYRSVIHDGSLFDQALFGTYGAGLTQVELAEMMETSQPRISELCTRGMREMAEFLNGTQGLPADEQPGGTLGDGPGTRRVVSNQLAINSNEYHYTDTSNSGQAGT